MNDLPLDSIPTENLVRAHSRIARIGNVALVIGLLCLTAGIWIDVRWALTSVIPFVAALIAGFGGSQARAELKRRKETT